MISEITTPFPYPNQVRVFPVMEKPLVSFGRQSYILRSVIQHDEAAAGNILVGHFTSIANDNTFLMGNDHPMGALSTYMMDLVDQTDDVWNEWISSLREREWTAPKCQIMIGHDVWIGRGCTIMGGVRIGNGACVAAGSLVCKDVPPYALVGGVPAKVIRYRFPEETIRKLQQIKWWYWPKEKIKDIVAKVKTPEEVIRFAQEQEKIPVPQANEQLSDYKRKGYTLFFFRPGDDGSNLLPHVLEEYHRSFTQKDKTCLIVDITKDTDGYQAMIDEESNRFKQGNLVISILTNPGVVPLDVLQNIDYLITNRDFHSVILSDYTYDFGVKLLYGYEENLFASVKKQMEILNRRQSE